MRVKKIAKQELRIVLDTNVLYTQLAHDILKTEVKDLIYQNKKHSDLDITWHLPEIVISEREYQMFQSAKSLLPSIGKVERLLRHNLAITEDTLTKQVSQSIELQLSEFEIKKIGIDVSKVTWAELINNSVYRKPPFEIGDKEKGFRDAIVLETFIQFLENAPRSPSKCRVVLVTNDKLLIEAVSSRINDFPNATILPELDDLLGLINTLASQVSEEYIKELGNIAKNYFFTGSENKETLYYKEGIRERIMNDFSAILAKVPDQAESRISTGITISQAQFSKKFGQRVHWVSKIKFNANAFRAQLKPSQNSTIPQTGSGLGLLNMAKQQENSYAVTWAKTVLALGINQEEEVLFATGYDLFEVLWSVLVDKNKKFSKPLIHGIQFIETSWENA